MRDEVPRKKMAISAKDADCRGKRAAQAAVVLAVFHAAGCAAILGDFSATGDAGADADLRPDSGLEEGPPGSANPDAMGEGGGTEATTGDATNPGIDGSGGTCSPQTMRCSGNGVQTCDKNGAWGAATPCPSAKPLCNGAGVCGVCADSSTRCSAGGGVETCIAGAWLDPVPCMNTACSMGVCTGTCLPNAAQCSGNGVQRCDATGHWGPPAACLKQACVSGACQGVCAPGDTACSAGGVQKCDPTGAWGPAVSCGPHQSCAGGGSAGAAACACNTDPTCSAAGPTCGSAATLAVCAQDSQACWYASSSSTCSGGACFGTAGSARCCANACTNGATQCGGAGLQTCQVQGNGCTAWNAGTACGPHQSCTGVVGSAACTCNTDPVCSGTGTVCAGSATTATCAQDTQSCYYASSSMACGANKNCQSGACVCNSGYTACGSNCVNINNDNNHCGGCNTVCPVLSSPSSGSTCGTTSAGKCTGYLGGYVPAGGGPLSSNPDGQTVFAVRAQTPALSGTFVGIGAMVGSNDASGTTQMIFGLYSDSGGAPANLLFQTNYNDPSLAFADPSPLFTLRANTSGLYHNGFNGTLTANTTYWVYMKAGTGVSMANIAGVSSSPCVGASWINVDPPISWPTSKACPGDFDLYLIETFP